MLYVTTRSKHDAYTAPITLHQDRGPDGGLFIPFRMPEFDNDQIQALSDRSFGENVADILNIFFTSKLTGWDVDMCIGRAPVKLVPLNRTIVSAEMFHNMDQDFERILRALSQRIHPDGDVIGKYTDWSEIAIRIAVLFGIFGELLRTERTDASCPMDVAVCVGDFAAPMACWYARQMGLPIGTIICGCNENSAPWDLLHRGELDTGAVAVKTSTPDCDHAVPPDLERLICGACGQEQTMDFCWSCTEGADYVPSPEAYDAIRQGMFAAVVSSVRVETIIPSVYRTNHYLMDLYSALAYGAVADHRSRTGTNNKTLLLAQKSPACSAEAVAKTMHISTVELLHRMSEV